MVQIGFVDTNSPIHRLHPLLKLFIILVITTSVFVIPGWQVSAGLVLLIVVGMVIANIGLRRILKKLRSWTIFAVFLFVIQILIVQNGTILVFLVPRIGWIGPLFPVTDYGIERGLTMSLRFLVIVFSSVFFASVTDPTLLAYSLTRIGVSYRHSFMLVLALRFIPLFDLENQTVRMAQNARGIPTRTRRLSEQIQLIRYTLRPLLISALSRVDSLTISMEGRGFGYTSSRTFIREARWSKMDTAVSLLVLLYCILCVILIIG